MEIKTFDSFYNLIQMNLIENNNGYFISRRITLQLKMITIIFRH